jgi:hypothetical protein
MRPYSLIPLLFASALMTGPSAAQMKSAEKDALAQSLEATYNTWAKAVREKNAEIWQSVTASYTKMIIRNTVVSQKLKFPDAFFATPMKPPAIDNLIFLGAQAAGMTAQAVYFGRVDFQIEEQAAEIPENILVLRFIKEAEQWKFDTTRVMSLAGMGDLEKDIRAGNYEFLKDEAFTPPGIVPKTPKACAKPERIAHLQLMSIGYETEVIINGNSRHFVANNTTSELILGGLKNGSNAITFRTRAAPRAAGEEAPKKEFGIRIVTVDDHAMKDPVEVFQYQPEEGKPAPSSFKAYIRGQR